MKAQPAGAFIAGLSILLSLCAASPKVTIEQGTLRGKYLKPQFGRRISAFLGIPFAKPPVGNLRFRAPVPAERWKGTFDATKSSEPCPQPNIDITEVIGNEDCLKLNIFVPKRCSKSTKRLPVMVWLHSGAFLIGSNSEEMYGPHYLLQHDVILVSLNYRLGMLGFMTTGDSHAPGNYGLKDQILGLQWVQKNIAKFGGDPDNVTLFGENGGGMSAHILSLSDRSKGLFHRMITQSGIASTIISHMLPDLIRNDTVSYAKKYDCPNTEDNAKLVAWLRNQTLRSLVLDSLEAPTYYRPTVEPVSDEAVLTDTPFNIVKKGKVRDIPWISGVTENEGMLLTAAYYNKKSCSALVKGQVFGVVSTYVKCAMKDGNTSEVMEGVMEHYFGNETLSVTEQLDRSTDMVTDVLFLYPVVATFKKLIASVKSPLYLYLFGYRGSLNRMTQFGINHGDELAYIFSRPDGYYSSRNVTMKNTDLKMIRTMTQLWTSFATHGVPTLAKRRNGKNVWPSFEAKRESYLHFIGRPCKTVKAKRSLGRNNYDFWDSLLGSLFS